MKPAVVIPARYASSRLPGKPLLRQTGKYLVQHVYERACQATCANIVLVATDEPRIPAAGETPAARPPDRARTKPRAPTPPSGPPRPRPSPPRLKPSPAVSSCPA